MSIFMQKDIGLKEIVQFIKLTLRPFYKYVSVMFISGIVWAIDLSLRPYLFKIILNTVSEVPPDGIVAALKFPVIAYISIMLFLTISYRLYDFFIEASLLPLWRAHILQVSFNQIMEHDYTFFQRTLSGTIAAKMYDLTGSIPDIFQIVIDKFINRMFAILFILYTLWSVGNVFALMTAIWVGIFIVFSTIGGKKLRYYANQAGAQNSLLTGSIVDIFSNISTVWIFSAVIYEKMMFKRGSQKVCSFVQQGEMLRFYLWLFVGITFLILQACSLYFLVQKRAMNLITVGDFSLIMTLNSSLANFIWDLARDFSQFSKHWGRITQSLSMLHEKSELVMIANPQKLEVTNGEIKFDEIQFYFRGSEALFQNKTILIPGGQKVGLVGTSGSGKSTFVNLILRLYDVKSGHVFIDGQDIKTVTLESLRDSIVVVPQEPALFHRSVAENIAYGKPESSMEEIQEAAKKAHIHDTIMRLPNGYDTIIGEHGFKPSGGEKQRIAIARSHLERGGKIFILDEVTSQLDPQNEASVLQDLRQHMKGKTTLIIAHRFSTLLYVDRILVFHQGKIVEDGTHEELLALNGFYRNLWNTQKEGLFHDVS